MEDELIKYFTNKSAELQNAINASYPAKNKFSSQEANHNNRHSNSNFAHHLRSNTKNFGTNYKIEE